ncbi:succinyl-diaminopimelate desuccinylase [Atractiella rhizophila]|nr:succinyl-diaminopimelate desuccinylase [Atractiella rhizophila]
MSSLSVAQREAIKQASHAVLDDCVDFLKDLISIDTTNPPGLNYPQIAELIASKLSQLGYDDTNLLHVAKEDLPILAPHDPDQHPRVNVVGRLFSKSPNPNLVEYVESDGSLKKRQKCLHFNGHTDVVPAGNLSTWTSDPFKATIRSNKDTGEPELVGRGVSDMKGGIAAQVFAIEAVRRAGLTLRGTVEQSGVVDEESTGIRNAGAGWLVEQGHVSASKTDGVIITEPLGYQNVCCGHRGAIWGTITFYGRASHGSTPQRGVNALEAAAEFIVKARASIGPSISGLRDENVIPEEARASSLTFTVLNAGANTNSVPDLATLRFDRRLVPGETLDESREALKTILRQCFPEGSEVKYEYHENYSTDPIWVEPTSSPTTQALQHSIGLVIQKEAGLVCSPGTDDQRFFVRKGMDAIVYGPGRIRDVHNADEALRLEDLRLSIEIMALTAIEFLGID